VDNLIKCIEATVLDLVVKRNARNNNRKFLADLLKTLNVA
jgi:hypothetical protein